MIVDSRLLPDDEQIDVDVCIVGAGPAGLALAHEWIGAPFEVCLLEGGGMEGDQVTRELVKGESVGFPYDRLDDARFRAFGGLAHTWTIDLDGAGQPGGARLHSLDASDFEKRDWVPHSGWPFDRAHLQTFYERAYRFFLVGPAIEDEAYWFPSPTTPDPPISSDRMQGTVFQFAHVGRFVDHYRHAIHQAGNVRCLLFANVTELVTDDAGGAVVEARAACLPGVDHVLLPAGSGFSRVKVSEVPERRFSVRAKVFVLAAGAPENARLLLVSSARHPGGLGNQHDLVGRFFMEHPHIWSGRFLAASNAFASAASRYRINRVNGVPVMAKWVVSEEVRRRERLLGYCVSIHPISDPMLSDGTYSALRLARAARERRLPRRALRHVVRTLGGLPSIARDVALRRARRRGRASSQGDARVFRLDHMAEQVPNPQSRVTLSDRLDALGMPRVRLDWRVTAADMASLVRSQEILDEELRRAGVGRLQIALDDPSPPPGLKGGWHHMGTTRMHADPRQGVVDEDGRVHGVRNLYVTGSSVFPTGGYANPLLTVGALAIRLADHLKAHLDDSLRLRGEEKLPEDEGLARG